MDKTSIIEKVYFDPAGFGSVSETLKDANKYDKSIKIIERIQEKTS